MENVHRHFFRILITSDVPVPQCGADAGDIVGLRLSLVCVGAFALLQTGAGADAQTADKFDLVCAGTVVTESAGATDFKLAPGFVVPGVEQYSTRLRADLSSGTFCEDDCPLAEAIALVEPDAVVFRSRVGLIHDQLAVSRTSGVFRHVWDVAGNRSEGIPFLTKTATGTCSKAPYTAMPASVF